MSKKASEMYAVVGAANPTLVSSTTSTITSGWVDAKNFDRFSAVIQTGALGAGSNINAKIQQASDSSGTGAKDVTGKAITQLANTDDNKQAVIDFKNADLDAANSFNHVRLSVTISSETSDSTAGGVLLAFSPIHYPASDNDASTVAEIV